MTISECKVGMRVICTSKVPKGSGDNPPITKGDILTISRIYKYEQGKGGINFEEEDFLWYPEDFILINNNVRKIY